MACRSVVTPITSICSMGGAPCCGPLANCVLKMKYPMARTVSNARSDPTTFMLPSARKAVFRGSLLLSPLGGPDARWQKQGRLGEGIRYKVDGGTPYAVYRMQSTAFTPFPSFVTLPTGGGLVPGLRASL